MIYITHTCQPLPVIGVSDWLLIYENTLLELSVKDAYDELEISVV